MVNERALRRCLVFPIGVVLALLLAGSATNLVDRSITDSDTPATLPDEPPSTGGETETGGDLPGSEFPPPGGEEPEQPNSAEHEYPWDCGSLPHFHDEEQLSRYLTPPSPPPYREGNPGAILLGAGFDSPSSTSVSYSGTNNQVEGVDEADIIKTDGEYIYTISRDVVKILRAYLPEEASLLSTIVPEDVPVGLFINGDRLVVLTVNGSTSGPRGKWYYEQDPGYPPTGILLYDVTDRSSPMLVRDIVVTGRFMAARMIGDYVYLVADHFIENRSGELTMPVIWFDGQAYPLEYSDIGFLDNSEHSREVVVIVALHLGGDEPACYEAFLAPNAAKIYVSARNIYIGSPTHYWIYNDPFFITNQKSRIHKISIRKLQIDYIANRTVDGTILNQFSMDEYDDCLRVATTNGDIWWGGSPASSNVYVLNAAMELIGQLKGIAPGEIIHSARFIGERGYLVTFMKIDPFFVIDLSDPTAPSILGYLKIPGFSDYLHPYDETHIIGLGKDTVLGEGGQFSWFQGVKLSLFDVADVEHPVEAANIVIGDRGTDSEALRDHKAFLFDRERNLLVIPIKLHLIDRIKYPDPPPYFYGEFVWQGAYVIDVSVDGGFDVRGKIAHFDDWSMWKDNLYAKYHTVRRSLYIEESLYVVSPALVTIHDLDMLVEVGRVELVT